MAQAERGIAELMESADTTIVIPNEKLLAVAEDAGFFESFRIADDILRQGVQGISTSLLSASSIALCRREDIMAGKGYAVMGTAPRADWRTIEASKSDHLAAEAGAIDGARGILINITGSSSLKLSKCSRRAPSFRGCA
jgi:cell division protein FtsZ